MGFEIGDRVILNRDGVGAIAETHVTRDRNFYCGEEEGYITNIISNSGLSYLLKLGGSRIVWLRSNDFTKHYTRKSSWSRWKLGG